MDLNKEPITLILPVETINVILNAVGTLPYVTAAPIIERIQQQAQSQINNLIEASKPKVEEAE